MTCLFGHDITQLINEKKVTQIARCEQTTPEICICIIAKSNKGDANYEYLGLILPALHLTIQQYLQQPSYILPWILKKILHVLSPDGLYADYTHHFALADNATHAAIGALSGIAFAVQFYEKTSNFFGWFLIFSCFVGSSLIDIDHFIAAKSWNLEDATNVMRRPFLHCSTLIIGLLLFYICNACLNYFKWSLFFGMLLCAFITHHTRDAVRRGYWFYPWGNTDKIPNIAYVIITIATPYILGYTYAVCRSSFIQQFVGKYIKLNDKHHHHKDIKGYKYVQV